MALVCFWFSICIEKLPIETYFHLFKKSVFITCVLGVLPEIPLFVQVPWSVSLMVSSSGFKFWFLLRFLMSPELYAEGEGKEASSVLPTLGICISQQHFLKRLSVHLWCMFLATCLGVNQLQKGGFLSVPSGVLCCAGLCYSWQCYVLVPRLWNRILRGFQLWYSLSKLAWLFQFLYVFSLF